MVYFQKSPVEGDSTQLNHKKAQKPVIRNTVSYVFARLRRHLGFFYLGSRALSIRQQSMSPISMFIPQPIFPRVTASKEKGSGDENASRLENFPESFRKLFARAPDSSNHRRAVIIGVIVPDYLQFNQRVDTIKRDR